MLININVRDKDGKMYKDAEGFTVGAFATLHDFINVSWLETYCKHLVKQYQAITGSKNVNIDCFEKNEIARTYICLYSYCGAEKRFVKLT